MVIIRLYLNESPSAPMVSKDDTPEADGSAPCRPTNVFENGGENHVYQLFTYILLNSALGGKEIKN